MRARAALLIVLGLGGILVIARSSRAETVALTLAEYARRLDALSTQLASASPASARDIGQALPSAELVTVAGTTETVPMDWLKTALSDAPSSDEDWRAARARLVSMVKTSAEEARRLDAASVMPSPAAQDTLRAVLSQRAYAHLRDESWQAELRREINQWLADLWERTVGPRLARRAVTQVLAWTAGVAAVLVLMFWLLRAAARGRRETPIALGTPAPPRLPGHILAAQALALLRAGESREGARLAYRAAVHRLEEEGALRIDDARTPREHLTLLPAGHRRRGALARLTGTFERIWYGSRSATAEERSEIVGLLQDLECLSRDLAI